jgi:hypothetical protein
MERLTIQPLRRRESLGAGGAPWRSPGPLVAIAGCLVVAEAALTAVGLELPALSVAALVLAPGLALTGLLPARARESWTAVLAAAPVLGLAASTVALVSLASAGAPLEPAVVLAAMGAIVTVGLFLPAGEPVEPPGRGEVAAGVGLLGALAVGVVLHQRVLGGFPVPGNDWAKYALYADEIRSHGSLLIDNPFWMLGVPFREDPGIPALYGAYLRLADQPAPAVAHGIALFAALQVLSVFALVRTFWSAPAAVTAGLLWAALPLTDTLLGWHGLANAAALALLALLLLYAAALLRDELDDWAAAGAGLTLVALAAVHRLSLLVACAALAATAVAALALLPWRRVARPALAVGLAALVLSPGVVYDLVSRNRTFGGTLDYTAYLSSKLDLGLLIRDLTLPFAVAAAAAVAYALVRAARERALVPLLCLLGVAGLLACSYLVHFPLHYTRMAYYLPLALVPLLAVAVWRLPGPSWSAALVSVALGGFLAVTSFVQADNVDRFYSFANRGSLRGLDAVAAQLKPGDVIVTDRCWSFLATWLLHTRTLPALDSADIQPKAELPHVRQARAVLAGTPEGRALARRLPVRFALVDPGCSHANGRPSRPPAMGRLAFASQRLVVLRLGG